MLNGPGKYDSVCTALREATEARAAIVIIFDGRLGNGFSMQGDLDSILGLPETLEKVAADIRAERQRMTQ